LIRLGQNVQAERAERAGSLVDKYDHNRGLMRKRSPIHNQSPTYIPEHMLEQNLTATERRTLHCKRHKKQVQAEINLKS
ncbi:Sec7-N domain containing protein, partial [Pyrenophora tritici-repentis]